ncbi:glycosyltransferase family 4 protein [Nocardiopsis sp. CNT-189]
MTPPRAPDGCGPPGPVPVAAASAPVAVVLPAGADDPAGLSGGDLYDRRVVWGLAEAGRPVREHRVPGKWPDPGPADRAELARALAACPDGSVVLADGLLACAAPDIAVPEAGRLRIAVLVHLPLADETGLAPAAAAGLEAREREVLRAAAAVVATGPWAGRELAARYRLPADRVHVVPPGTDPAPPASGTDGASGLLCVASVTPRKGHDLLVEALAAVADLPWECRCAGPAERAPEFTAEVLGRVARHGLGGRVRLAGPLAGAELEAAYAAADLVVLPSRAETFGMAAAEALARGIPVLAAAAGALPETIGRAPGGDVPGLLVPPGDAPALAAALRRWLTGTALRRRLRRAARLRAPELGAWPESLAAMSAVLDTVAAAPLRGEGPR